MIRYLYILLFFCFLFACAGSTNTAKPIEPSVDGEYIQLSKAEFLDMAKYPEKIAQVEIVDLYDDSGIIMENDTSFIYRYLHGEGFDLLYTSQGNWEHGARIFSLYVRKDTIRYQIDKLYYSTENGQYKITERIKRIGE
ncbi:MULTISPECIES: hypothetical protein [unclassified Dysgonomonas]|uniref:hypothetical protein n=1 Tax=unclassified Dysgonomonas TaxID=2630389 RepID=UPI002476E06F|nr:MULTISPECIES: hypothetical protein [unclassified Dysgonomonas]